jgi:hypothetical protein
VIKTAVGLSLTSEPGTRRFLFERDTFAFAHELVWQYRIDPATGATTTFRTDPPPTYFHRCFVMVRATRQFFYHACFEPGRPAPGPDTCRELVQQVIARNCRVVSREEDRVLMPGYSGLRSFSQAHEALLKEECGGPWESYFLRSHWRMVFPVPKWHQERIARQLCRALRDGQVPLAHLFRFPHITINHGIVLFGVTETDREIQFEAYDPNIPGRPTQLTFDRELRAFWYPQSHYFGGGSVGVIEVYRNAFY